MGAWASEPACHLPQAVTARPACLPAADIRYVPFQTPWANGLQVGGRGERICSTPPCDKSYGSLRFGVLTTHLQMLAVAAWQHQLAQVCLLMAPIQAGQLLRLPHLGLPGHHPGRLDRAGHQARLLALHLPAVAGWVGLVGLRWLGIVLRLWCELGSALGCLPRHASPPKGVNRPPFRLAGILPTIAVAWSLLYYRYRWGALCVAALGALPLQFSFLPPHHRWHRPRCRRCKPSPADMPMHAAVLPFTIPGGRTVWRCATAPPC